MGERLTYMDCVKILFDMDIEETPEGLELNSSLRGRVVEIDLDDPASLGVDTDNYGFRRYKISFIEVGGRGRKRRITKEFLDEPVAGFVPDYCLVGFGDYPRGNILLHNGGRLEGRLSSQM